MSEITHNIDGKEFTHTELSEAFDNVWNTLKRYADKSAESKVRAANFCLKCIEAGVVPGRKVASVSNACSSILKAAE
jgi:hypothetical protein